MIRNFMVGSLLEPGQLDKQDSSATKPVYQGPVHDVFSSRAQVAISLRNTLNDLDSIRISGRSSIASFVVNNDLGSGRGTTHTALKGRHR